MRELKTKEILKRALSLQDDKLLRLLEDLPDNALIKLEQIAYNYKIDLKNPEFLNKINDEINKRISKKL